MADTREISPEAIKRIQKRMRRFQRLVSEMWIFYKHVRAEDCAGIGTTSEPVQYKHDHKSAKIKGGKPSRDFTAVEILVDFRIEMENHRYEQAISYYYTLKRMLNWSE